MPLQNPFKSSNDPTFFSRVGYAPYCRNISNGRPHGKPQMGGLTTPRDPPRLPATSLRFKESANYGMISLLKRGGHMIPKRYPTPASRPEGDNTIANTKPPSASEGSKPVPDSLDQLTRREREVLALIADGSSTKEIAARLQISFKTAVCHRSHIMAKTGSRNCVTLILYAIRQGLIDP